jgi:hypothetical protein
MISNKILQKNKKLNFNQKYTKAQTQILYHEYMVGCKAKLGKCITARSIAKNQIYMEQQKKSLRRRFL